MRGRTVLLVVGAFTHSGGTNDTHCRVYQTHNVSMASPIADFVVALGTDGRITSQGSIASALEHDQKLAAEVAKEEAELEKAGATVDEQTPNEAPTQDTGKLVVEEEVAVGHVGWQASTSEPSLCSAIHSTDPCVSETLLQWPWREPPRGVLAQLHWRPYPLHVPQYPGTVVPWILGATVRGNACV